MKTTLLLYLDFGYSGHCLLLLFIHINHLNSSMRRYKSIINLFSMTKVRKPTFIPYISICTKSLFLSATAIIVSIATTSIFLFCCAAYLCAEILTRPERARTDDFCTRYARKTAKIFLLFAYGNNDAYSRLEK